MAVEVANKSGSGISTSSEVLASLDRAHVSLCAIKKPLISSARLVLFCYLGLFTKLFAWFVSYELSRGFNVWSGRHR